MESYNADNNSTTTQNKTSSVLGRKKSLTFSWIVFGLLFLVILIALTTILYSKTIYPNVIVLNTDVGGYTKEKLSSLLETELSTVFSNMELTFSDPYFEKTVRVSDIGIEIDVDAMVNKAYGVGREGNLFNRIASIMKLKKNPVTIDIIPSGDSEKFEAFIEDICKNTFSEIIPSNILIYDNQAILCTGIPGREADKQELLKLIIDTLTKLESTEITVPVNEKKSPALDIDTTLSTLNRPPINAEFVRTSRTTYEITPHQMGLSLDRASLMEIISYVENRENNGYEEIKLPVEFITPDITTEELEAQTFRDTLSTCTTYFTTKTENNYNRGINIGIAANCIDGTILLPGEKFSFNEVVGPRTAQKGYRIAHVYVDGQIKDGIGGGICQVSTTLYNAVLKANLEVTERHNHMFTVSYVPLGHDAAVSYGYADLVFTNTTSYPLRINATYNPAGSLTFSISCTNDCPDLKVKLATKTISTIPFTVVYISDSTLPQGVEIIAEKGLNGYVVDTYITVYNGDQLIREEKLHRSYYQMYPRKILRGDAPASEFETDEMDDTGDGNLS